MKPSEDDYKGVTGREHKTENKWVEKYGNQQLGGLFLFRLKQKREKNKRKYDRDLLIFYEFKLNMLYE